MGSRIQISKKLVLINSGSTFLTKILTISVVIWLQQYLLRQISPEEYSLLPVVSAIMVFVPLATTVLTSGLARYAVAAYASGDDRRVTQIVSTMTPVLLAAGLLVLVVGGTIAWNVGLILNIAPGRLWEARMMLGIQMAAFALRLPLIPFTPGISMRQRYTLSNAVELGSQLLSIGLLFVLLFGVDVRVLWVVVASSTTGLLGMVVLAIMSRRMVPALRFKFGEFHWEVAKELTGFGAWQFLGQLARMIRTAANPLILNRFATAADVASFHVGSMADREIYKFMTDTLNPIQSILTAMHATGEKERLRYTYMRLNRLSLWAALLVAVPLCIFRRELFQLYLQERYSVYVAAAAVMGLTAAHYPVTYATNGLFRIAVAMAKVRAFMLITLGAQLLNVGLALYLVGALHMGAVGSALAAFIVALGTGILGNWPLGLRLLGLGFVRFFRETLLPGLLPCAVGAAASLGLRTIVHPSTWLSLGACMAGGTMAYAAAVLLCLQPADRNDLRRILTRVRRAVGRKQNVASEV